jgi:hypothetical protein
MEKECLAIVWAILQLRPYLEGKRFVIRTDHKSLGWVLNLADAQCRLARWRFRLLEFDFEVQYSPEKAHHGADTMSRLSNTDPEEMSPLNAIDTEIPCFPVWAALLDPRLLPMENVGPPRPADPSCCERVTSVGAQPKLEYDDFNVPGRLPPGENFEQELPEILGGTIAIVVVREFPLPVPASQNVRVEASQLMRGLQSDEHCSITTVTRIFGDLVLNRAELCCRLNVQILVARLHVRRQLSPRVGNYFNSRLVHVRCHLTYRPLMTPRDVNS